MRVLQSSSRISGIILAGCFLVLAASGCARREAYQLLDLANEHEAAGYEGKAIETYGLAVDAAPADAYLQRALGRAFLRRREYDRARDAFLEAVTIEPAYLEAFQDLISVSLAQDDPDAALGWLERAALSVPEYAPIYEQLVAFYLARDENDEAMTLLDDLVERFPQEAWIPFRQGNLFRQLTQTDEALKAYGRASDLDDALPDLWAEIGNLHYDLESYDEAEDAYARAIEQYPRDHRSMNNLAWVHAIRGRGLSAGIELSRAALELREEPSYMDTLAELYYKQGDRRRALVWIRRALRVGSDSQELNTHLRQQLERFRRAPYGRT